MLDRRTPVTPDALAELIDLARQGIVMTDTGVTPEVQAQLDELAEKANAEQIIP